MENVMTNGFCELNEQEMMEVEGGITQLFKDIVNGIGKLYHEAVWGKANAAANQYIMNHPDTPSAQIMMENPNNYVPIFK